MHQVIYNINFCCKNIICFRVSSSKERYNEKIALTTLAVMAAVGVLAVQPADAKGQTRPSGITYRNAYE